MIFLAISLSKANILLVQIFGYHALLPSPLLFGVCLLYVIPFAIFMMDEMVVSLPTWCISPHTYSGCYVSKVLDPGL